MRMSVVGGLALALVVAGVQTGLGARAPAPAAAAAVVTPLRVMPLGDSNTEGGPGNGGWRTGLYDEILAGGYAVDLVGSNGDSGAPYDDDNEGHGGWEAAQLAGHGPLPSWEWRYPDGARYGVDWWVGQSRPDVLLVMAGTNDILHGVSPQDTANRVLDLVDRALQARPGLTVVVGQVPRMFNGTTGEPNGDVPVADERIAAGVQTRAAQGAAVRLADTTSGMVFADYQSDGVHLTPAGYAKLGALWFAALKPLLQKAGGDTPYGGAARPVPATIEAEHFDVGGEGVGYSDADSANRGGAARTREGVDLVASGDRTAVGFTADGEWLDYTIRVPAAGTYTVSTRYAGGGALRFQVDGSDVTSTFTLASTGSSTTFADHDETVSLAAGDHVLRVLIATGGLDLDRFTVRNAAVGPLPDGTYRITDHFTQQVLDVPAGSATDGLRIVQYPWSGGDNQRWTLTNLGDGYYTIRNVKTGLNLSLDADGYPVQQTPSGADAQKWHIDTNKLGTLNIGNAASSGGLTPRSGAVGSTLYLNYWTDWVWMRWTAEAA